MDDAVDRVISQSTGMKAFVYTELGKLAIQIGGWAVVGYMMVVEVPKMRESYDSNTRAIVKSVTDLTIELKAANNEASRERESIIKSLNKRNGEGG